VQGWQDRDSGTDASPNGATSLSIPGVAFDRVSYMRGDRTDWWELNVVQPCTLSVMVTSANATDGLRLTLFDRRGRTALQKVENRGSYLIATLPVNRPTVFFAQVMASRLWDSSIYTIRAVAGGDSLYIASLAEGRTDSGMIAATGQNIARPDSAPELRFNAITNGHVFVDNGKGMTWWRLTSERTGTVSISVYGRDGQPSPAIAVFDAKQQPLEALNARETEPVVAVMGAEAYFVRLSTENRNAPLPYELTATFMEDPEVFSGADREPGGARILPLQGAVEDTVSSVTGDRTDWWKVTLPANGLIGVDMTGQDLHGVRAALYEEKTVRNRRQTEFSGAIQETNGNGRLEVSGKSGDVYYLSVLADAGASPSPYSLQARFMIDPDANSGPDAEPSGAKTLPVDGGSRGAVDYDHGDRTDWWRLTTPGPGRMVITLIVRDPSARLSMELYDQQGASNVSRSVSAGNGREEVDIEAAGRETYLVKVFADKEGDASAYQLMTWYTMAPDASSGKDATPAGASALIIGTPSKGDVDYDGGDRTDWWKIRVPGRGNMTVDLNGENFSADLDIAVYDAPDAGEALATSHTRNSSKERVAIEVDRAGWYYIEVTAQKSGDKSRYTLKASFEP
jgi:hypothetical protein